MIRAEIILAAIGLLALYYITQQMERHTQQAVTRTLTVTNRNQPESVTEQVKFLVKNHQGVVQEIPLPEKYRYLLNYAPYVGTLYDNNGPLGMACLLQGGMVATALHVVCDFPSLDMGFSAEESYRPLDTLYVLFSKPGSPLIRCQITDLIEDGMPLIARGIQSNFDLAILKLNRDPSAQLAIAGSKVSAPLSLDDFNHFGSAYLSDPEHTLAISGPIQTTLQGKQVVSRYLSKSSNEAFHSEYKMLQSLSDHPVTHGYSGMAMMGLVEGKLVIYAIHSGRDKIDRYNIGVSVSEYISSKKIMGSRYILDFKKHHQKISLLAEYHVVSRAGNGSQAIRAFLNKLKGELAKKAAIRNIDIEIIPESMGPLPSLQYIDTHQRDHVENTRRPDASFFYPWIASSENNKVLNTLMGCMQQIAHLYCEKKGVDANALRYKNPIIDVGFNIGLYKDKKTPLSHIKIDGFPADTFHIFPVDPDEEAHKNPVYMNANELLPETIEPVVFMSLAESSKDKKKNKK